MTPEEYIVIKDMTPEEIGEAIYSAFVGLGSAMLVGFAVIVAIILFNYFTSKDK